MEISVIKIGNSKGIRLSKTLIDKYKIKDSLEVIMEEDCLVLKPVKKARENWLESFESMRQNKDDEMLMDDVLEDEDFEEWK